MFSIYSKLGPRILRSFRSAPPSPTPLLVSMSSSSVQIPVLRDVEKLSPRVIRILGGNPGKFTLQGTNTYLIGTGPSRILIDTAQGHEEWATSLSSILESEGATISTCLLTHWHPDHILGVPDLLKLCPDAKIYKHRSSIPSLVQVGDKEMTDSDKGSSSDGIQEIQDGQVFMTQGAKLTAIHSPGHTDDHISFLLDDEAVEAGGATESDSGTVFSGDNVLGHGTTVFEDLALYLGSLTKMRDALHGQGMMYPAHGDVVRDGRAKIDEYVQHRKDRENQVVATLKGSLGNGGGADGERKEGAAVAVGEGSGGLTSWAITKNIYQDVDEGLLEAADRGIKMILEKLEGEGRVRHSSETWWLSDKAKF